MKAPKGTKLLEWVMKNKEKDQECPKCRKMRELTVEHIIPVHLLEELGLEDEIYNDEENFELLCILCNRFKGGRLDMAHPKTILLLKKYINSLC